MFMRNRESAFRKKGMFSIIMASMPRFSTYRVKVEQIILLVKIANRYFERK